MHSLESTIKHVEDEIVFALREKLELKATFVQTPVRVTEQVKYARPIENRDLEAAIDDMLDRFPTTLDYLAK